MSSRSMKLRLPPQEELAADIEAGISAIQAELGVHENFPAEVEALAQAAATAPRLPQHDRTELELVTIDPPTSRDLDQALHIARTERGFLVSYAIADVAAFVAAGDAVDLETHRRGESLYGADRKVPLHPYVLSEGAASLLPGEVRPALLWELELDENGLLAWETEDESTEDKSTEGKAASTLAQGVSVQRALVRSREKLDYAGVQQQLDAGTASPSLTLLREVGLLREQAERARGGVSLPRAEQEVVAEGGAWRLEFRRPLPVEGWNAQISLLTGFSAAALMIAGGVGLLRVLPPAAERDVAALRRIAAGLGLQWPVDQGYADFVRALNPGVPHQAAMINASTRLLRGSGYLAFTEGVPEEHLHAALAAPYAHTTAPLRRLVDRYAGEIALAHSAGTPVPDWVLSALPTLPETMREAARRSNAYERAVVDLVEAGLLRRRVGESFSGVIVAVEERDPTRGMITLHEPAIEAPIRGDEPLELGAVVQARLTLADVKERAVAFRLTAETAQGGRADL